MGHRTQPFGGRVLLLISFGTCKDFYNYLKFSYIYITYLDHIHSSLCPQLSLGLPTMSSSQLHVLLIFTHSFILSTKSNKCCPFAHRLSSSKEEQGTYQQPHHQRKIVLPSNHQLPIFMLKFPSHEFFLKKLYFYMQLYVDIDMHLQIFSSRRQEASDSAITIPSLKLYIIVSNLPCIVRLKLGSKSRIWS